MKYEPLENIEAEELCIQFFKGQSKLGMGDDAVVIVGIRGHWYILVNICQNQRKNCFSD
jgi:hypothetical protein